MSTDIIIWALAVVFGVAYFVVRGGRKRKEKSGRRRPR